MKVLVTGGTGYLGGAVVRALARRGHEPVTFARRAPARGADLAGGFVAGDIRDRDALLRAARDAGAVIHTAALVSMWQRDPAEFDRVNVGGLETVIDVCATLRVPRLVYTSSFLALPPAGRSRPLEANDYQRSKVRGREVARAAARRGVPVVTLAPGVVYGPGAATEGNLVGRMVRDHLAGRLPAIVGGAHVWPFAFVDDVADAHVRAAEGGPAGEELALGGENAPQVRLFEVLRSLTGRPLPRQLPRALAFAFAAIEEAAAGRRRPPRVTRGVVKILHHDWPVNPYRSVEKLSYRTTSLETGVKALLDAGF